MYEPATGTEWAPSRDFATIRELAMRLRSNRSPIIEAMLSVQRHYDGDLVVPLPDMANEPTMPNLTPQLVADVVDGLGMRASSVMPMTYCPSIDPTDINSTMRAQDRRRAIHATYHASGWRLGRRRAMRHLNAYETMALVVEPDFRGKMPKLRIRNPLEAFPEEKAAENLEPAEYVAFITRFSGSNLRWRFPVVREEMGGPIAAKNEDQLWDILEWHDCEQIRYGLLGPIQAEGDHVARDWAPGGAKTTVFGGPCMPLTDPIRNYAERCLAFMPQAVTLHSIGNRLNRLLENVNWQNRLMALEIIAQEKAIFPDMYVMSSKTGQAPRLINGKWHDGRSGVMNEIEGADNIGTLNQTPDLSNRMMIDRMERNFRQSAGLMPQWGGETGGAALRTGRALGQMAEISSDPRLQELHEIDEVWMSHVNGSILAAYKGWWPSKKYTMFSGWPTDRGQVTFIPSEIVETVDNTVSYPIPGADIVQLTQVVASMHGSELISSATAQQLHPFISDPDHEQQTLMMEKLERATVEGLLQQVMSGQLPIVIHARIMSRFRKGNRELVDVIEEVDNEVREEQMAAQRAAMQQQQMDPSLSGQLGLAAGPAAAAPGALPPQMQGPPSQGPAADMRAVMAAANPLAGA